MFENEDFDLDESWFVENLPSEPYNVNTDLVKECIQKQPINNTNTANLCPNNTGKLTLETNSAKKMMLKRKFPGPAGLFPQADDSTRSHRDDHSTLSDSSILNTQYLCSQNVNLTFQEPAWIDMCKDLKGESTESTLLNKYNIEWIRNNVTHNLVNRRVPILVGIIKQIKSTSKSPIFVMADPTGELEALISPDLHEDLSEFLNINSVLVLKKFSILSINKHKYYLNITADNLIRIYSCKDVSEDIKIVHIQKISNRSLEQEIKDFVNTYEGAKYVDDNFEDDFDKMPTFNVSKLQNVSTNMICKSGSISKLPNNYTQHVKQNCVPSNDKNLNGSLNRAYQESISFIKQPSTSTNIFEQSNNSSDLNLNLDDFQEEFPLPEGITEAKSITNSNTVDCKKRKLDLDKCISKPDVNCDFKESKCENISHKLSTQNRSNDISRVISKNQGNIIDCSQISILTQNNENPDLIKEIFSDLDAAALFDEDF